MDVSAAGATSDLSTAATDWLGFHPLGLKKEPPPNGSNNNVYSNGKHDFREQSVSLFELVCRDTKYEITYCIFRSIIRFLIVGTVTVTVFPVFRERWKDTLR